MKANTPPKFETELVPCDENYIGVSSTAAREKILSNQSLVGILHENAICEIEKNKK